MKGILHQRDTLLQSYTHGQSQEVYQVCHVAYNLMRLDERNMLALTSCLYRDPIQSYRRKRITLSQSVVLATVRDLGHRLTATIAAHGDDFE